MTPISEKNEVLVRVVRIEEQLRALCDKLDLFMSDTKENYVKKRDFIPVRDQVKENTDWRKKIIWLVLSSVILAGLALVFK